MRSTTLLIAALVILTLCAHPAAHAEATITAVYLPLISVPPPSGQTLEEYALAQQVVAMVNSERAAASPSCAPLSVNDKLVAAAQGQSQDMALNNFFSHTNPDPSRATVGQRTAAAGYSSGYVGENIAAGFTTANSVMYDPNYGWMHSPGHRANILNCDYTEIGVGYYDQPDDTFPNGAWGYQHYWTQVFGKP